MAMVNMNDREDEWWMLIDVDEYWWMTIMLMTDEDDWWWVIQIFLIGVDRRWMMDGKEDVDCCW